MNALYLLPDTTVALAALAALMIVISRLRKAGGDDALVKKFGNVLSVVAVFLGLRSLFWLTELPLFLGLYLITVCAVPMMVLLLTEGLLRRHAQLWVKAVFTLGFAGMVIATLWPGFAGSYAYKIALLLYQLTAFTLIGWMVITRDKKSLGEGENSRIAAVGLSLFFILPFLVSDFRIGIFPIPVRLSGLAILVTCWLSLNLTRPHLSRKFQLLSIISMMIFAAIAGVLTALQFQLGWSGTMQVSAITASLLLLFDIARNDIQFRQDTKRAAILTELGARNTGSLSEYLAQITKSDILSDTLIASTDQLRDFDAKTLLTAFDATPFVTLGSLPSDPAKDSLPQSQLRVLFDRYGANQAYEVASDPVTLAFVRSSRLSSAEQDPNLSAIFGLARLIAKKDQLQRTNTGGTS